MKDFEWVDDIGTLEINRASNTNITYDPVLTDEVFNEVKKMCIRIWNTYDNDFGYVDEKVNSIQDLPNDWWNVIRMIKMFHFAIQRKLFEYLSKEAVESIKLAMYDRGWSAKDF